MYVLIVDLFCKAERRHWYLALNGRFWLKLPLNGRAATGRNQPVAVACTLDPGDYANPGNATLQVQWSFSLGDECCPP